MLACGTDCFIGKKRTVLNYFKLLSVLYPNLIAGFSRVTRGEQLIVFQRRTSFELFDGDFPTVRSQNMSEILDG